MRRPSRYQDLGVDNELDEDEYLGGGDSDQLSQDYDQEVEEYYQEDVENSEEVQPTHRSFFSPKTRSRIELARHCAFPSLPLDYPGLGPSQIWLAEQRAKAEEEEEDEDDEEEDEDEDDEESESDNGEQMLFSITGIPAHTYPIPSSGSSQPPEHTQVGGNFASIPSVEEAPEEGFTATAIKRPTTPTMGQNQPGPEARPASCVYLGRKYLSSEQKSQASDNGGQSAPFTEVCYVPASRTMWPIQVLTQISFRLQPTGWPSLMA